MNGICNVLRFTCVLMVGLSTAGVSAANRPVRPFENGAARRPSVSPYMNLVNNPQGSATNYQSLVRPQMDQSNVNTRQRAAISQLQRQAPTRSQSTPQGNGQMRGTGHSTRFNDTSRYYPALRN